MTDFTQEDLMLNLDEVNAWFSRLDQRMAKCRLIFEAKVRPLLNQIDEMELAEEMQSSIDGLISEFSGILAGETSPPDDA